ncbi:MAG: chromate efflux transporter [Geminicoccaceae bacterium]|nr:chromate efflux transporter [Geminicoccaceae bacterium]
MPSDGPPAGPPAGSSVAPAGGPGPAPSLAAALRVWARIGLLSFGGPAGQIALMHREIVERHRWLDEREFLSALNLCMLLPGPEATQLATYAGWRLHGVRGGLAAGLLFVLPGALAILVLAAVYLAWGDVPLIEALFFGIKAAVLVIVVEALLRIGRRALLRPLHWAVAAISFVGIFFFEVPYPLIVLAAGAIGYRSARLDAVVAAGGRTLPPAGTALGTATLWATVWLLPLAGLWLVLGGDHVLVRLAGLFSVLAVVTFGGAYAVLAYLAQAAVDTFGWLSAGEMLDGLGLAETTPGPLILVTEFVGFIAAARTTDGAAGWSFAAGLAGALVTLWATFAPCFLWIFTAGPYVRRLAGAPRLEAALQAVTAAVVGVILNLSLWFALHVWLPGIEERHLGPLRWWHWPEGGPDLASLTLSAIAAFLLLRLGLGMAKVLVASAVLGVLWSMAG